MRSLTWSDLTGWDQDDHAAAWAAFSVAGPPLSSLDARARFEADFVPVEVAAPGNAHFTGYYEPELAGARTRSARFCAPLYAPPGDLDPDRPWHDRATIVQQDLLAGNELVWLESPLEAFLAQVQGSLRVRLADGGVLRLGYAGKNGHPYRSIGAELVRRGIAPAEAMSIAVIRDWCAEHPDAVPALLDINPSFVFFRALDLTDGQGPLGALGVPLTPMRSLAVDPAIIPLGTPVWIDGPGFGPRVMIAQDVGSAIKGAGRGDIFFGSGETAGQAAGRLNARGRMVALFPKEQAA
jgi:membrane-bound lytic murein transglycosylase A